MKLPKLSVGTPILVIWTDAFVASSYWTTISELTEIKDIHTYGFYLKRTSRYLTIAQSSGRGRDADELDGYGGAFSIPLGSIRKVTRVPPQK